MDSVSRAAIVFLMLFSGIYSYGFSGNYDFVACTTFYTFGGAGFSNPSTSCFIILPCGPEPCPISDIFIALSFAKFFAAGLAKTRFPVGVDGVGADLVSVFTYLGAYCFSSTGETLSPSSMT